MLRCYGVLFACLIPGGDYSHCDNSGQNWNDLHKFASHLCSLKISKFENNDFQCINCSLGKEPDVTLEFAS